MDTIEKDCLRMSETITWRILQEWIAGKGVAVMWESLLTSECSQRHRTLDSGRPDRGQAYCVVQVVWLVFNNYKLYKECRIVSMQARVHCVHNVMHVNV